MIYTNSVLKPSYGCDQQGCVLLSSGRERWERLVIDYLFMRLSLDVRVFPLSLDRFMIYTNSVLKASYGCDEQGSVQLSSGKEVIDYHLLFMKLSYERNETIVVHLTLPWVIRVTGR
eukprot:TRINITY_DN4207_c0_g2_i2.p1 TRINITY_DN4207_c0_g2~~TRINITY_DN4207_c0_g2_i2.p1  ORF type:complete len:117 (+),score=7.49 TRINITY_DN4207_c0_g2_i2:712-1062(+)